MIFKKIRSKNRLVKSLFFLILLTFLISLTSANSTGLSDVRFKEQCRKILQNDKGNVQAHIRCWNSELDGIIKNQGLNAGLDFLTTKSGKSLDFQVSCHNLAHHVGEVAYQAVQRKEQLTLPNVHLCGNGFYHGFVGAVVKSGGDLGWAIKMCQEADLVKTPDQLDECLHGVGHGLAEDLEPYALDTPQTKIATGLKACQDLRMDQDSQKSCDVGIYGWILSQSRGYFKVYIPPLELCQMQTDIQKGNCLHASIRHILNLQKLYPELLSSSLTKLPDEKRAKILSWLSGSEAGYELTKASNIDDGFIFCRTLGGDLASECFKGYVHAVKDISQSFSDQPWSTNVCGLPVLLNAERQICPDIN